MSDISECLDCGNSCHTARGNRPDLCWDCWLKRQGEEPYRGPARHDYE